MLFRRPKDVNMLEGPLIPKIIAFAVPLMLSNLLQVFYSAADMIIVRQSGVAGAVGAIGTTNMPVSLIILVFIGFSVGTNVVVARHLGAKEYDRASVALHTSILTGLLFGLLGGIVGFLLMPTVMTWMGSEDKIWEMAVKYSRIRFCGLPFLALTNFQVAAFRAKGDSTTPLVVLGISGALNVLLNSIFVTACGMDVDGVAWATVASQVFSAAALFWILTKDTGPCRVEPRKLRIDRSAMWEILRIGVPAGMQSAMYALSNTLIMSSILRVNNTLCPGGSAVIDGNSAALSIGNLISTCNGALALSYVSFTSQHAGAKQYERLRRFIGCAYLCCVTFSVLAASIILLARRPLLSLYVSEEMAFETAELRMSITVGCYFLCACMECGAQILRGLGKSTTSALITFVLTCLGRVVWIYTVFEHFGTLKSIYISYPITWGLAALGQFIALTVAYRKQSGMPLIALRKKTA